MNRLNRMYYKKGESEQMKQDGKLFCLYFGRQLSVTRPGSGTELRIMTGD